MAEVKPVAAEQVAEPAPRTVNWPVIGCLIVMMLMGGCTVTCGVGGYVAWRIYEREKDDSQPAPKTRLADEIRAAGVSEQHALYFSKVCNAAANAIEVDGTTKDAAFDQRGEVVNLVGMIGRFSTLGTDAGNYPRLPAVITSAFDKVFEVDKDGKLKGGALTTSDRAEAVKRFRELGEAFAEVAQ